MPKRYFYSDPLAAAWMAKHFGMRFQETFVLDIAINSGRSIDDQTCWFEGKAYIHPDSLRLLDPRLLDIGIDAEGTPCKFSSPCVLLTGNPAPAEWHWSVPCEYDTALEPVRIIQRNGLAFMWPESEEV